MGQAFWQLQELSDEQLLCGLAQLGERGRRVTAELVAHLAEVEHRRLHLHAACGSLFEYCVTRLGLSEDEACRRIEASRLGRRFPELFELLANGDLSLSVAALLKPYLTEDNHRELLDIVAHQSVRQARERLAERFPQPDVASSVRKLPASRVAARGEVAEGAGAGMGGGASGQAGAMLGTEETASGKAPAVISPAGLVARAHAEMTAEARRSARIEPLSAERYRVQFTAGVSLKEKLESCRDLLRHQNPSGDLAPIVEQALELLLERLMKQRFGRVARASKDATRAQARASKSSTSTRPSAAAVDSRTQAAAAPVVATEAPPRAPTARIDNATRRAVSNRDRLCCTWVDPSGKRCVSRAWLEFDHHVPRGKDGGSDVENVRLLCRPHNQLSAELHYGRAHVARAIAARKSKRTAPTVVRDDAGRHERQRVPRQTADGTLMR